MARIRLSVAKKSTCIQAQVLWCIVRGKKEVRMQNLLSVCAGALQLQVCQTAWRPVHRDKYSLSNIRQEKLPLQYMNGHTKYNILKWGSNHVYPWMSAKQTLIGPPGLFKPCLLPPCCTLVRRRGQIWDHQAPVPSSKLLLCIKAFK